MPSQVLLAGGPVEDENGLEEIVLWSPEEEEEEADGSGESEEEDGPGPPLWSVPFLCFLLSFLLLSLLFRGRG